MALFNVGQSVLIASSGLNAAPAGRYKIVCPLPETNGITRYRVKGEQEQFERVVEEGQMKAAVL